MSLCFARAIDGSKCFSADYGKVMHQETAHDVVSVLVFKNLEVSLVVSVLESFLDLESDLYFL